MNPEDAAFIGAIVIALLLVAYVLHVVGVIP